MKQIRLTITVKDKKRSFPAEKGSCLSQEIQKTGIPLETPCGGYGTCGKCRVIYLNDPPSPTPAEKKNISPAGLKNGIRLACQHRLTKDTHIRIEEDLHEKAIHILTEGVELDVDLIPDIPEGWEEKPALGLAIDLGTTTLVVTLFDLKTGKRLGLMTGHNPQNRFGADIISRATAATETRDTLKALQTLILEALNSMIKKLSDTPDKIIHAVLAGNAVMSHLFLGIPMDSLVTAPYIAPVTDMQVLDGETSGLNIHPRGKVTILPGIGSFIGGDISADILVCREMLEPEATFLLMDLGTNCEIVLKTPEFSVAASAPAGPVMEGAGITHGMQAEGGAVSDLLLNRNGHFQPVIIGNQKAKGLCGSGLIHIIYTLWKEEMITSDGRFNRHSPRVDLEKGFRIADHIYLTPMDIRAFQMAKGAIAATWKMLLKDSGLTENDLDYLVLTGGFGHYIRPEAGMGTGLFPHILQDKFLYPGNGSLIGCELLLKNKQFIPIIQFLADIIKHVEMAGREDFQEAFVINMEI